MKVDAKERDTDAFSRAKEPKDMAFPGARWEESAPEAQGVDTIKLRKALSQLAKKTGRDGVSEVVVVRNGRMIWRGERSAVRHDVWSCTKSFTSTILGLLVDRGSCSPDTPARAVLASLSRLYPELLLRHFATMTSGYDGGGDQSMNPYSPSTPLFPPGTKFQYWDSAANQFLHLLTRISREPARELFRCSVAEPIGLSEADWGWGDFGRIDGMLVNGGAGNKGKGVWISALGMARFGLLFLNRGRWEGDQLVNSDWVDMAVGTRVPANIPLHGLRGRDGPGCYGFGWWTNGRRSDGTRRWPHAPEGTFAACGFNNNRCFVIPEWNLVFMRLGRDGNVDERVYDRFFRLLGKALP